MASHNRTHASDRGKVIPDLPDVPTIGTATAISAVSATIGYTASATGGTATSFTALSNPGSITATGTSSPITIASGLTPNTSYTFTVRANNSTGSSAYSSSSSSITMPDGPSVSGYSLWLDAADATTITSSSGAVSQWRDKSNNAYVFNQSTSTNRPTTGTATINSKNVLSFDGTNDSLISSAAASTWNFLHNGTNYTVFTVSKLTSITNGTTYGLLSTNWAGSSANVGIEISSIGTAGSGYNYFIPAGSSGTYVVANSGGTATTATTIRTDVIQPSAASANRWNLYLNGGTALQYNTRTDSFTTANADFTLQIGASYSSGGASWNGSIAEILIYPSALSDTDRASVRNYLNTKWGAY